MITRLTAFGDSAFLLETGDTASAHRIARAIEDDRSEELPPGAVEDVVVGLASVVVRLDPLADGFEGCERWLARLISTTRRAQPRVAGAPAPVGRRTEVPVTFDGPDLAGIARATGLSAGEIAGLLTGGDLEVAFVGFAPGFPYLVGLPTELAAVARRSTPRRAVPAGSVAVAGGFASVYPTASPGGWMLLGRTSVTLFDPDHPPYALLRPGDTVRFTTSPAGTDPLRGGPAPARPRLTHSGPRFAEVLEPGLLSLVQDAGRRSLGGVGVPRAGPCDAEAMVLVNRLLGNADGAATVEVTASGPTLRVACDAHIAVVVAGPASAEVTVDDLPVTTDAVVPVRAGQRVRVGPLAGSLRAYLGTSGGFETPVVVGSRASDVLSGLGPGHLRRGDRLGLGPPGHPRGLLTPDPGASPPPSPVTVRVLAGPHDFDRRELDALVAGAWAVGDDSNRVGLRLRGEPRSLRAPGSVASLGMIGGAIQVPPDGNPIVLMPDHATLGGYPVVACVITADLPLLGRLRPGDAVHFAAVDAAVARRELVHRRRTMAARVSGWFPTAPS